MTFMRYIAIQLLAYAIDMGTFLLVLSLEISGPVKANILAKLAAGAFAFIVHRYFTFQIEDKVEVKQQAFRYFLLLALNIPFASFVLAILLMWIAEPVVAKFIADIVSVALTYWMSKRFIFTSKQKAVNKKSSELEI